MQQKHLGYDARVLYQVYMRIILAIQFFRALLNHLCRKHSPPDDTSAESLIE
jgi:hypothetical protein